MQILKPGNGNIPRYIIKVNGQPLAFGKNSIMEISVTEYFDTPSICSIKLNDPDMQLIDRENGIFTEGSLISASIGYMDSIDTGRTMFFGDISSISVDFSSSSTAAASLECYGVLHRLRRGVSERVERPVAQVLSDISKEAGLEGIIDSSINIPDKVKQDKISNMDMLVNLAGIYGFYFWAGVKNGTGTLNFSKNKPLPSKIELTRGRDLLSFSARLSISEAVSDIVVFGKSSADKAIKGQSSWSADSGLISENGLAHIKRGADGKSQIIVRDPQIADKDVAGKLAASMMQKNQQIISANGSCIGNPDIQAGSVINIVNAGRFSGEYDVYQVTHTYGSSGYRTQFQLKNLKVGGGF